MGERLDEPDPDMQFGANEGLHVYQLVATSFGQPENKSLAQQAEDAVLTAMRQHGCPHIKVEAATSALIAALTADIPATDV